MNNDSLEDFEFPLRDFFSFIIVPKNPLSENLICVTKKVLFCFFLITPFIC